MTEMASKDPSIPEWFRNRNVFITGGTGFMGKVLVYKLLSSCPDLGNVFLLVREKKGLDSTARLHRMMQDEPFKVIKEQYPERLSKIVIVNGDTMREGLGLSSQDRETLVREVSVVFHMAANVKFDLPLKDAVKINTEGTANVLALVKQHTLEERAYASPVDPVSMITTVNNLADDVLEAMAPKLLGDQPNTYAFSKALSEELVQKSGLPAGVCRPSIVLCSWKEPAPGWVENMNGPTGLMIGAGKGVLRTFLCNGDNMLDAIPCDMAINATISLAWRVGLEQPSKPIFMNVTISRENSINWRTAVELGRQITCVYPYTGLLWYPGGSITSSKLYHFLRFFLFQLIPAYLIDCLIYLSGNKPFLVRVQQKVSAGMVLLQYYTTKEWIFRNDYMKELQAVMSPKDREVFFFDTKVYDWKEYVTAYMLGTRKYCLKDDPSTLPQARKVLRYYYIADKVVKIAFFCLFCWFVYSWLQQYKEVTTTIVEAHEI